MYLGTRFCNHQPPGRAKLLKSLYPITGVPGYATPQLTCFLKFLLVGGLGVHAGGLLPLPLPLLPPLLRLIMTLYLATLHP